MSQFAVTLCPNDWDLRTKVQQVSEKDWKHAVEIVRRRGYSPTTFAGLDRLGCRLFARALGQALEQEAVPLAAHEALRRLHEFLTGPGAGGFVLTRSWAW